MEMDTGTVMADMAIVTVDMVDMVERKKKAPVQTALINGSYQSSGDEGDDDMCEEEEAEDLNMRAIFLHILGDFAASIAVIISGCLIQFTKWSWRYYTDPFLSIIVSLYIVYATLPLCKHACTILMQTPSDDVPVHAINDRVQKLQGVSAVKELHVWQLHADDHIGTIHVDVDGSERNRYDELSTAITRIFNSNSVSSVTVQLNFV